MTDIRGVYPRGLIEAHLDMAAASKAREHIRGVYPRGLIEAPQTTIVQRQLMVTSAGSTPAASLKLKDR